MVRGRRRSWVACVVLLVAFAERARANGTSVGFDAGAVFPLSSPDIQLVSEDVSISLPLLSLVDRGRARCSYEFRNLSPKPVQVAMAFVTDPPFVDDFEYRRGLPFWQDFEVRQDDRRLPVRLGAARGREWKDDFSYMQDSLPVWDFTIGALGTTHIEMQYEVQWSWWGDSGGGRWLKYYTRPAALWAGTVGRARFRLELGDSCLVESLRRRSDWSFKPEGYCWTARGLEWNFRDWVPTEDIHVEQSGDPDEPGIESFRAADIATCQEAGFPALSSSLDGRPRLVHLDTCVVDFAGSRGEPDRHQRIAVRVLVDDRGHPEDLRLKTQTGEGYEHDPGCVRQALETAWRARFAPAMLRGKPVTAWTDVVVQQRLVFDPDRQH